MFFFFFCVIKKRKREIKESGVLLLFPSSAISDDAFSGFLFSLYGNIYEQLCTNGKHMRYSFHRLGVRFRMRCDVCFYT